MIGAIKYVVSDVTGAVSRLGIQSASEVASFLKSTHAADALEAINKGELETWLQKAAASTDTVLKSAIGNPKFVDALRGMNGERNFVEAFNTALASNSPVDLMDLCQKHGVSPSGPLGTAARTILDTPKPVAAAVPPPLPASAFVPTPAETGSLATDISTMPGRAGMDEANWLEAEDQLKLMKEFGITETDVAARAKKIWEIRTNNGAVDESGVRMFDDRRDAVNQLASDARNARAQANGSTPQPLQQQQAGSSAAKVANAGQAAPVEKIGLGGWLSKTWFRGNISGGGDPRAIPAVFGDTGVRLPEFQSGMDLQKFVLRRNWNPFKLFTNWAPVGVLPTESRPIMRGIVYSVDTFMKEKGLVDSIRTLEKNIIARAKAGHNGIWEFKKFAVDPAQKAKLQEFHDGIKELRDFVAGKNADGVDNYPTIQGKRSGSVGMILDATPGLAHNTRTGLSAAQKNELLVYLDDMMEMAKDLKDPNGRIAASINENLGKVRSGAKPLKDFEESFTGLSRAYSYAMDAEMRLTGVVPGTDRKVAHQWNERLVRSLQEAAYNGEHLGNKIDITRVVGSENLENTWQNQILEFAERKLAKNKNANGEEYFVWDVTKIGEFFSPLESLHANGHAQEAIYSLRDLMLRSQAWGRSELNYIPSAGAFRDHFIGKAGTENRKYHAILNGAPNPEFSASYKKWADQIIKDVEADEASRAGAPIKYLSAFEANRQNRHFYMSRSYPFRMGERWPGSNGADKLWTAKPLYNFIQDRYVVMPLQRLKNFLTGHKETHFEFDLKDAQFTLKQTPVLKAKDADGKLLESNWAVARRIALRYGSLGLINDISKETLIKPWKMFTKLGWLGIGGTAYALATHDAEAGTKVEAVKDNLAVRAATLPGRTLFAVVSYPFKEEEYTLAPEIAHLQREVGTIAPDAASTPEEKESLTKRKTDLDNLIAHAQSLLVKEKDAKKKVAAIDQKIEAKQLQIKNTKGTEAETNALKVELATLKAEKTPLDASLKATETQIGELTAKIVNRRKALEKLEETNKKIVENEALLQTSLTDSQRTKAKQEGKALESQKNALIAASAVPNAPPAPAAKPAADASKSSPAEKKDPVTPDPVVVATETVRKSTDEVNMTKSVLDAAKAKLAAAPDAKKAEAQEEVNRAQTAYNEAEKKRADAQKIIDDAAKKQAEIAKKNQEIATAKAELEAAKALLVTQEKAHKDAADADKKAAADKVKETKDKIAALEKTIGEKEAALKPAAEKKPEEKKAAEKQPEQSEEEKDQSALEKGKKILSEFPRTYKANGGSGNPVQDGVNLVTGATYAFNKAMHVEGTNSVTQGINQVIGTVHLAASKLISGTSSVFKRAAAPGNEEGHAWLGLGGGIVGGLAGALAFSKLSETKWLGKIGSWPFIGPLVKMIAFGAFFMMARKGTHALLQGSGKHGDEAIVVGDKPAPKTIKVDAPPVTVVSPETLKKNLIDARAALANAEAAAKAAPGDATKTAQLDYAKRNLEFATGRATAAGIDPKAVVKEGEGSKEGDTTGGNSSGGDTRGASKSENKTPTEGSKNPGTTEDVNTGQDDDLDNTLPEITPGARNPEMHTSVSRPSQARGQSHDGSLPVDRRAMVMIDTSNQLPGDIVAGLERSMQEAADRHAAAQGRGLNLPRNEFAAVSLDLMSHTRGSDSINVLLGKDFKGPTPGLNNNNPEMVITA